MPQNLYYLKGTSERVKIISVWDCGIVEVRNKLNEKIYTHIEGLIPVI